MKPAVVGPRITELSDSENLIVSSTIFTFFQALKHVLLCENESYGG